MCWLSVVSPRDKTASLTAKHKTDALNDQRYVVAVLENRVAVYDEDELEVEGDSDVKIVQPKRKMEKVVRTCSSTMLSYYSNRTPAHYTSK